MAVKAINDEGHFQAELSAAGGKLVVVDFTATWCGPCRNIAPLFEQLPTKYPKAVFLKVDVDKCAETAATQGVSAMPTFIFYRARTKIDRLQGADINGLEAKIQKHYVASADESGEDYGQGMLDLNTFIQKNQCECLNEADDHPWTNALTASGGHLASDCDEQLIISITFNQVVKLHSLKIKAPPTHGPKHVKLFINQPRTLDFDMADSYVSVQDLEIDPKDLETGNPTKLRFVKFQNVQNIQLFVKDNQSGGETTIIDHLAFIGQPIATTKMDDFQRVAGKKGESH
ncbi:AGAP005462-PA [Anopheles gambiae str. PEST]|uniref:AGAP005462-PA n=1 Tax=Anopheles gambiae TaxID=7165 RepID=Q7PNL3_ANOGA|nr:thioredoxin-like protein 1 [Anopheles gambiae]EAA11972.3 AGAP005462-PA [Anopheles gambiae str. PEST]